MNKQKIIIDTDPGKDDVLAIMLARLSGRLDIKAITTVAGNSTIQAVTNNARYVVDLLDAEISLFSGASKPLSGSLIVGQVMGSSGLAGAQVTKQESLNGLAVSKIREIIQANPGEISILAIGPLTNIATVFQEDPELPRLLKSIVMMGGSLGVGNTNRVAEFNFYTDPVAAEIVFRSSAKKVLIPLDLCYQVPLFESDFRRLQGSKYFEPIWSMMESYIESLLRYEGQTGAIVYDALATYYVLQPQVFLTEPMDIQIETTGVLTRGMCVVENRSYVQKNDNVLVATGVNREKFKDDFLTILKNQ